MQDKIRQILLEHRSHIGGGDYNAAVDPLYQLFLEQRGSAEVLSAARQVVRGIGHKLDANAQAFKTDVLAGLHALEAKLAVCEDVLQMEPTEQRSSKEGVNGKHIARKIFECGDEPDRPTTRIQFKGNTGKGADTSNETKQGGFCESALAAFIDKLLESSASTDAEDLGITDKQRLDWLQESMGKCGFSDTTYLGSAFYAHAHAMADKYSAGTTIREAIDKASND